jgi:prevent-host-death family protein
MTHIAIFEAKNRLSALIAEVAKGAEITITNRGHPVAKLVPIDTAFDREKARRAAAGLRELSQSATLGGLSIKDLVNEGRP